MKDAYSTPLTTETVYDTDVPPSVSVPSAPLPDRVGSMPCRPTAAGSRVTTKLSALPFQPNDPNDDALRASSQVSICRAVTIGTPRACAAATVVSDSIELTTSVWALIV